jgi:hypothetical protein
MTIVRGKVAQRAANQNNQSGSLSEEAIDAYSKQWNERFRNVAEGIDEKHFLKMNQDTKKKNEAELRIQTLLSNKEQKKADEEAAEKLKKEKNENKKGFVDQILEKIGEVVIDMISPNEAGASETQEFDSQLRRDTADTTTRAAQNNTKEAEFSKSLKNKLGNKPYISSAFAQKLGLNTKNRRLSSISEDTNNHDVISNSPEGKTGMTLGFGHDVLPDELGSGKIHGIPFVDEEGNFIELSDSQLNTIFEKDFKQAAKKAEKDFNSKVNGVRFKDIPIELQSYLTDTSFNIGGLKGFPKGLKAISIARDFKTHEGRLGIIREIEKQLLERQDDSIRARAKDVWDNLNVTKSLKKYLGIEDD